MVVLGLPSDLAVSFLLSQLRGAYLSSCGSGGSPSYIKGVASRPVLLQRHQGGWGGSSPCLFLPSLAVSGTRLFSVRKGSGGSFLQALPSLCFPPHIPLCLPLPLPKLSGPSRLHGPMWTIQNETLNLLTPAKPPCRVR